MEWSFERAGSDFVAKAGDLVRNGPVVPVQIEGSAEHRRTSGLIDTGAAYCAIKPRLARKLGLVVIDRRRISGVSATGAAASGDADVMIARIGFDANFTVQVQVVAADFMQDDPDITLLLGRPFLQHYDMFYEGACGRFKLSWAKSHRMDAED